MSYAIRYILFLFATLVVSGMVGHLRAYFGNWTLVVVILVMIPVTIEVVGKVLKRDRL